MAAPTSITLGDALVTWLNDPGRNWPLQGWEADRAWDETLDATDPATAAKPIVQIVMEGKEGGGAGSTGRASWQEDFTGYVAIRQRYAEAERMDTAEAQDWIDDRVDLLEEIERQMRDLDLSASFAGYRVFIPRDGGVAIAILRDRIDQEVLRQYTGVLEFKFRSVGAK